MPKLLFIALHRPNRSPSQRFRYEQYINYLESNGWECKVSYVIKEKWDYSFYSNGHYLTKFKVLIYSIFKRSLDWLSASKYDVIYVQRESIMIGSSFFEKRFQKSKAKLIFDFDDAIWMENVSGANQKLSWLKQPSKTKAIIKVADLIIAGNDYLATFAKQYNNKVVVFPTTIDTKRHIVSGINGSGKPICIGWTGSVTTVPHFELAISVLRRLKDKYKNELQIKLIGDGNYKNVDLEVKAVDWNLEDEINNLIEIDIGIMPLPNDEWSKGKCGLKILQYMALEIPSVVSPVGVNNQIVEEGVTGFFANSDEEWFNKMDQLIMDQELRQRMGKAARKKVIDDFSVIGNRDQFLNYFNDLVRN